MYISIVLPDCLSDNALEATVHYYRGGGGGGGSRTKNNIVIMWLSGDVEHD